MLGVSIDAQPSQDAFGRHCGVSFPLLSDRPKFEVARLYEAWQDERSVARRVAYVIDKQGVVRGALEGLQDMRGYAEESLRLVKEIEGKP